MKIKTYIFIFVLVLSLAMVTLSCKGKVKVVPEISRALLDETVLEIKKNEDTAETIIAHNSDLVFFTLKGKIYRLNPGKKLLNFLYDLTIDIDPEITLHKDIVLLKKKDSNDYIVFDLRQMKVIKTLANVKADKIICVDADHGIIGYTSKNQLIFIHYPSGKTLSESKIEADKDIGADTGVVFYNSENTMMGGAPGILILSSHHLYIFDARQHSVETVELKHKAFSGFLLEGSTIYYGSEERHLVKFSLNSRKVKWKFTIADHLKLKPQKAGPYIVIAPEDNNIYFFNKRGTLVWWEKLNSTRLLPPVVMKENVAVFLWDKSIKFFNYEKKKPFVYPLDRTVFSNSLRIGEYLYVIAQLKTGEESDIDTEADTGQGEAQLKAITKIGNNYGVEIETDPADIIPMGKSIKFNLNKFNLIEPELKIQILNPAGESVFDKTLSEKDDPSFVLIPNQPGGYNVVIEVNAENKKELRIEDTFDVIDVEKILKRYYYHLQKYSKEDQVVRYPTRRLKIKRDGKTGRIPGNQEN
jgi:outer membrane protein assembly factor BamB